MKEKEKKWEIYAKELEDVVTRKESETQELNNKLCYLRSAEEELCCIADDSMALQNTVEKLQELVEEK